MNVRFLFGSILFSIGFLWNPMLVAAEWVIPTPTGYVWDEANVLTNDEELEQLLTTLAETSEYEMAVVMLSQLPEDETIETAATKLFSTWGIGDRDKDTGVLLMVSIGDRATRLETGYGVEGIIPDILAHRYTESMTPYFREGDYSTGVEQAVVQIITQLTDEVVQAQALSEANAITSAQSTDDGTFWAILVVLFIISGLGGVSALGAYLGKDTSVWLGGIIGAAFGSLATIFFQAGMGTIITGGIIGLIFDWIVSNSKGGGGSGGSSGGSGGSSGGTSWSRGSSSSYRSSSSSSSSSFGGFSGGSSGGGGSTSRW